MVSQGFSELRELGPLFAERIAESTRESIFSYTSFFFHASTRYLPTVKIMLLRLR
jgi:hypothetical protein